MAGLKDSPDPEKPTTKQLDDFALWGLGRGVDITKARPWLEKTSFEVRKVHNEHIIVTKDGGLLQAYNEEIRSRASLHSEVKAGLKPPNLPIKIGVDAEYTRSTLSSKHIVGTKVKNRTVSFRVDFVDVPQALPKPTAAEATDTGDEKGSRKKQLLGMKQLSVEKCETFEDRLRNWLTHRLEDRGYNSQNLQELICDDDKYGIKEDVKHFVQHFGVTHYVSSIELGALEYSVLTQKEYHQKAKVGANASLDALAHGGLQTAAKVTKTSILTKKVSEEKKIGKITDDDESKCKVVRKKDEAVIGCEVVPIITLVKNPYLQEILATSVKEYIKSKAIDQGPYLITCGDDQIVYLKVEQNKQLGATTDIQEAEEFMVKVLNESPSRHEFEFSITSVLTTLKNPKAQQQEMTTPEHDPTSSVLSKRASVEEVDDKKKILPLEWYLETSVSIWTGTECEPLKMSMNSNFKQTRMLLKKRNDHQIACDTKQWRKGREAYYLSCLHTFRNGYLCVEKNNTEQNYKVCVKPTVHYHSDENEVFMLFRLMPPWSTKDN